MPQLVLRRRDILKGILPIHSNPATAALRQVLQADTILLNNKLTGATPLLLVPPGNSAVLLQALLGSTAPRRRALPTAILHTNSRAMDSPRRMAINRVLLRQGNTHRQVNTHRNRHMEHHRKGRRHCRRSGMSPDRPPRATFGRTRTPCARR